MKYRSFLNTVLNEMPQHAPQAEREAHGQQQTHDEDSHAELRERRRTEE
jgi:hypothetical protein